MKDGLKEGVTAEIVHVTTPADGVTHLGPGAPAVFSTPAMIALMERTAIKVVEPYLEETEQTVGVKVNVDHLAGTKIGITVHARATLTGIEGRRLRFAVEAHNDDKKIGEGIHERMLIDKRRFVAKAGGEVRS